MTDEMIFAAAVEKLNPAERAAYLESACNGDREQHRRVAGLLAAHDRATGFLERPAVSGPDPDRTATRADRAHGEPVGDGVTRTHGEDTDDDTADALAFLEPPGRPDSLGRIGQYEVLEVLGRGGFGIVYRAFDEVLQRVVAVKVLAPSMAATSPARKRFIREAQSAALIQHENVVRVHTVGETPLPFLVMEFISGETLQQRLDRTGPLEVPEILRIGRHVAEGLAAAHEKGLIHRDIKPSNILIENGTLQSKITDFGLARAADDASLTRSGTVAGTPMYMAPEQAKGETLDHRADLFSLGSVMYAMATGHPPFRAPTTLAVLKRVAEETPRPMREVIPETPEWLCRIVEKLHAKNPADRYQSAKEVADVLADCEEQIKTRGSLNDFTRIPGGKPDAPKRRSRRKRIAITVGILALVSLMWVLILFQRTISLHVLDRAEVEFAPEPGWVSVMVHKDGAAITDWIDVKDDSPLVKSHPSMKLPPGKYKLEPGFAPGRALDHWEITTHGLFSSRLTLSRLARAPEIEVARGERVTVRAVMRDEPPPPSPRTEDSFVPLFNGKDLTGWKPHPDQSGDWKFENGILIGSQGPGRLVSVRDDYQNFHLRAEVAISAGGFGDICFRAQPAAQSTPGGPRNPTGYAVEMAEGSDSYTGPISYRNPQSGQWTTQGGKSVVKPDEWFTLEVFAAGNHLVTKVNGVTVVDFLEPLDAYVKGYIALQVWNGATIKFRKIEIKELPATPVSPAEQRREMRAKLAGNWTVHHASMERSLLPLKNTQGMEIRLLENGMFELRRSDDMPQKREGTYELDLDKSDFPNHQILFTFKGQTNPIRGIFSLAGNQLSLDFPKPHENDFKSGSTAPFVPDDQTTSIENLRMLGLAMHIYHDSNGSLPLAAIQDVKAKDGKPLLSWRVALLPHLDQEALYRQFKLDEPWDSEHNKKLIARMPKVFMPPGIGYKEPGLTHYRVFVGPGAAFEPAATGTKGVRLPEFADGTSNTIMIAESREPVIWTKPDELTFDPKKPLPKLGWFSAGAHVVMGDGSVRLLSPDTVDDKVKPFITRNGNEVESGEGFLKDVPMRGREIHLVLKRPGDGKVAPVAKALNPLDQADLARLKGEWLAQSVKVAGELIPADQIEQLLFRIEGDKFELSQDRGIIARQAGTVRVNFAKKELLLLVGNQTISIRCSYRLDGDRLSLDYGLLDANGPKPASPDQFKRFESSNNLKQLALAMVIYNDTNKSLPPAALVSAKAKDGNPLLSWRVAILPFIDQEELYKQFRLDEPWDSEHNKKLIARMPKTFIAPGIKTPAPGMTHYRVFVGPGTVFEPRQNRAIGVTLDDIPDGTTNTLLIVEAGEPVIWTRPDDLPFDPKKPLPKLGVYTGCIHVAFCDGSVYTLADDIPEKSLVAMIDRNGAENPPASFLIKEPGPTPVMQMEFRRVNVPLGAKLLKKLDPAKDKAVAPRGDQKYITVENGAYRIENALDRSVSGNFNVLLATIIDGIPDDGIIILRARVKLQPKDKDAWGDLMLGDASPSFHGYDWPKQLGEYRGEITEWTQKEVRYPVEVFRKKNPPSIPIYAGLHANGVLWIKDVGLFHLPAAKTPQSVLQPLRDVIAAKTKSRDIMQARFEAALCSKVDVLAAEAELIESRIALSEAEKDSLAVYRGLEQLVKSRQEEQELTRALFKAGINSVDSLNKAEARVAEAKVRLALRPVPPKETAPAPKEKK